MDKKKDLDMTIVWFIGLIGLILTCGVVWGMLVTKSSTESITVLTAVVSSVITGLLGIVVGKSL